MNRRILALALAVILSLSLMALPAAAEDAVTVSTDAEFIAAVRTCIVDKSVSSTPLNIKLGADIHVNPTKNASPPLFDQYTMVFPVGSKIDLNGHNLHLENVRLYYAAGTSKVTSDHSPLVSNGTVTAQMGNIDNTQWVLTNASDMLAGLVTDFYTASANAFNSTKAAQLEHRVPAGITFHLKNRGTTSFSSYTAIAAAHTLIISSGAYLDGTVDFHTVNAGSQIIVEAATAADLDSERLEPAVSAGADKILLTADITTSAEVELPEGAVLDLNGKTLTCAGFDALTNGGRVIDSTDGNGKIVTDTALFAEDNGKVLPLFDTDGYRFFTVERFMRKLDVGTDLTLSFNFTFTNKNAYALLADSGLVLEFDVTGDETTKTFRFRNSVIAEYGTQYATDTGDWIITTTFAGTGDWNSDESLSIAPVLRANGVSYSAPVVMDPVPLS